MRAKQVGNTPAALKAQSAENQCKPLPTFPTKKMWEWRWVGGENANGS